MVMKQNNHGYVNTSGHFMVSFPKAKKHVYAKNNKVLQIKSSCQSRSISVCCCFVAMSSMSMATVRLTPTTDARANVSHTTQRSAFFNFQTVGNRTPSWIGSMQC